MFTIGSCKGANVEIPTPHMQKKEALKGGCGGDRARNAPYLPYLYVQFRPLFYNRL